MGTFRGKLFFVRNSSESSISCIFFNSQPTVCRSPPSRRACTCLSARGPRSSPRVLLQMIPRVLASPRDRSYFLFLPSTICSWPARSCQVVRACVRCAERRSSVLGAGIGNMASAHMLVVGCWSSWHYLWLCHNIIIRPGRKIFLCFHAWYRVALAWIYFGFRFELFFCGLALSLNFFWRCNFANDIYFK